MTPDPAGSRWLGAVLAGGRSRRMGRDKAALELDDGRPMVSRSIDALRALHEGPLRVERVVLVGGDPMLAARLEVDHVPDPRPPIGPVGGVLAALDLATAEGQVGVVVLPCDLPALVPDAVVQWCADAVGQPAPVVVATRGGHRQFPIGLWRVAARDDIAAARDRGERAMHAVVAEVSVAEVPSGAAFADADTPGELDAIRYPESW